MELLVVVVIVVPLLQLVVEFASCIADSSFCASGPIPVEMRPGVVILALCIVVRAIARVSLSPPTSVGLLRVRGGATVAVPPTLSPIILAAATTGAAMYPLDLIRALKMTSMSGNATASGKSVSTLQLVADFRTRFGLKGFVSQGLGPELLKATASRSLKFFLFPLAHRSVFGGPPRAGTPLTRAAAGCLAAVPEVCLILPLEVAKLTLQLDASGVYGNSGRRVLVRLAGKHGPGSLYVGFVGVALRQALWTAAYFASVESCTAACERTLAALLSILAPLLGEAASGGNVPSGLATFGGGFAAGVLGVCLNNPPDVVRSVVQKEALAVLAFGASPGASAAPASAAPASAAAQAAAWAAARDALAANAGARSFVRAARGVVRRRGWGGLYTGFGAKALHLGGSGALMNLLVPAYKRALGMAEE